MKNDKLLIFFSIIGLIILIIGVIITIFFSKEAMGWALFGTGIAIIWASFYRIYHNKGE